jgi:hypothetical protein
MLKINVNQLPRRPNSKRNVTGGGWSRFARSLAQNWALHAVRHIDGIHWTSKRRQGAADDHDERFSGLLRL